ncbi:aminoglycoside phosphotransferase family protein, partial [Ornithinicoccus halotolerans]|uniref:aminoglycoside phosphotransferase family protein n=1 Tax=Ornithinicoccus halotolerans TaxID=1748220 RepID=UPI001E2CCD5F
QVLVLLVLAVAVLFQWVFPLLADWLDRPAPPWAPRLADHLRRLLADIDAAHAEPAGRRFPRRMLLQARALAEQLASEPGVDDRLVHTDLHGQNVLCRPDPRQWVAIDPKVMAADPAFAVAPVLWNRWGEAERAHDVRVHLNLRLETVCDAAGIDPDRARAFGVLRMVRNALWALAEDAGPGTSPGTQRWLTQAVTIVKALQPG